MLKRTKYSRLRNDSLTSLEDPPKRLLPLKGDLCIDSDFAQLEPGTPTRHGPSTLRDFIPRVASIRLHSPISLRGLRGQTSIDGHTDRPSPSAEFCSGPGQRFCSQPSLMCPQAQTSLRCTKRPITLHRMASLPWTPGCLHRDGLCSLKTLSVGGEDCTVVQTASRAIHHHIKVCIHSAWIEI